MESLKKIVYVAICLILSSCCNPFYLVDFSNETSTPVKVTYSTINMDIDKTLYYDTVSYEIGVDSVLTLPFKATYNNSVKKLSKVILFFKFDTPERSVCLEGPEEVRKVFSKRKDPKYYTDLEFVITDSLFNSKK